MTKAAELLRIEGLSAGYGEAVVLQDISLSLDQGDTLALLGRNGTGKSSLMRILAGLEKPDDGNLQLQQGVRLALVQQEPMLDPDWSVHEAVRQGLSEVIAWIDSYSLGEGDLNLLQNAIESRHGWGWEQRVEETLHRLRLNPLAREIGRAHV